VKVENAMIRTSNLTRRAFAGLAGAAALPGVLRAAPLTPATLRMDWALSGYQLPFYWAKKKGYYEAEGIDLTIKDGAGAAKAAQLVESKEDTFGLVDATVTVNSVTKGMHIKSILMVVQEGGSAIVSWAAKPMKSPHDMIGRSLATTADQKPLIELLLAINKVPLDQVTQRIVSMQARNTVFLQHQVDGFVSVVIGSPMDMIVAAKEGKGEPIYLMPFSDFGIRTMATGAVVHDDTIAAKPELVRGFTHASCKAMNEIDNEAKADEATDVAMALSGAPATRRESVKLQWLATLPRLRTQYSKDKPLGWTSVEDWNACIDLLVKTDQIAAAVPADTIYTNAFIS
jgi:NitT/TauT family transport system substrate-binding protein